jgi:HemY protein
MLRIIIFLVVIALAAAGASWVVEQPGSVVLTWRNWRAEPDLPTFVGVLAAGMLTILIGWSILTGLWRTPSRLKFGQSSRRSARARHAITQGLLAVGHGDGAAARSHANAAKRHAPHDPLALLLQAQSAQLEGDTEGARRAFLAMAARNDTKSLGMRGLFIEAQRADDPYAALAIAEEALRLSPYSPWAAHAVLGFRCARADWTGALEILENSLSHGLIDKKTHRRQRAVLLTARAIDAEDSDENLARDSALEANKLAPTLVPAAVLAAKYLGDAHQVRRSMKVIEAAWQANPHPDLAAAYAHLKPGDTASARLSRIENLVAKNPTDFESAIAVSRAAIDAGDFRRARASLERYLDMPTQRVAMLMAEIEHGERGDTAKARAWTLRAVRALHDPAWTADGYVSDHWRPVSPVTGRLDAFQWQVPVSALPSNKAVVVEDKFQDSLISSATGDALPAVETIEPVTVTIEQASETAVVSPTEAPSGEAQPSQSGSETVIAMPPLFHRKPQPASPPPVIPIVRAPDDPGIEDDGERSAAPAGQSGGWRGYRPRRDG